MRHSKPVVSSVHTHKAWRLWASVQWSSWAIFPGNLEYQCPKSSPLPFWKSCSEGSNELSCGIYSPYYHYSGNKMKMAGDLNILNVNTCLAWHRRTGEEDWRPNCFLKRPLLGYTAYRSTFIPTSIGSLKSPISEPLACVWLSPLVAFDSAFSALSHQLPNTLSSFQILLILSSLLFSSHYRFMCFPECLLCCFGGVSGGTRD